MPQGPPEPEHRLRSREQQYNVDVTCISKYKGKLKGACVHGETAQLLCAVRKEAERQETRNKSHTFQMLQQLLLLRWLRQRLRRVSPSANRSKHTVTFMFPANMSEPIVNSLRWILRWFLKRYQLVTPRQHASLDAKAAVCSSILVV